MHGGLRIVLYGLAGLVLTPVLTMLIGYAMFGHRSTWNVGQGDSFLVFLMAMYATPVGAVCAAFVASVRNFLGPETRLRWVMAVAVPVYLGGLVAALLWADWRYG